VLAAASHASAGEICERLREAILSEASPQDDITVVV
jgi:hypothetical protein